LWLNLTQAVYCILLLCIKLLDLWVWLIYVNFLSYFPWQLFFKIILYHKEFFFFCPSCFVGEGLEPPKPSCQIQLHFEVLKTNGELQVGEVMGKNWRNRRRNVACISGKRSEFQLQQIDTACSNALLGLAQGSICRNTDINKCLIECVLNWQFFVDLWWRLL
jgi:hypothetical protein